MTMSEPPWLLTVPNFSFAGDDDLTEELIAAAAPLRQLVTHTDADHGRTVITFAGHQGHIAPALARMARLAAARIDIVGHPGVHPHVGAIDVAPVVYARTVDIGAACAEALTAAHEIATEAQVPVFLYGELAGGRERAPLRAGGAEGMAGRVARGEQQPDFGGPGLHPKAGATLVAARPPLVAFNFELHPDHTLDEAKAVAAALRESGGGPPGVRAIGLWLASRDRAQVSCNVHDPFGTPLATLLEIVTRHVGVTAGELVGLAPEVAFAGFPSDLPVHGFDPATSLLENVLPA
jgi:glutamate formiminotransferase